MTESITVPSLIALSRIKLEKVYTEAVELKKDWIKNKRCECVSHIPKGCVLTCEHYRKELNRRTKEEGKKLMAISVEIARQRLREAKAFTKNLD